MEQEVALEFLNRQLFGAAESQLEVNACPTLGPSCRWSRSDRKIGLLDVKKCAFRHQETAVNQVLQLTDISWPIMIAEQLNRAAIQVTLVVRTDARNRRMKWRARIRGISNTFAQSWHSHGQNRQPLQKVLPERTVFSPALRRQYYSRR